MKGEPTEIHGPDVMTKKHGAVTDWMEEHGENLESLEEGDMVNVIDEGHASTSTQQEYRVSSVPSMKYDFHHPAIKIIEPNVTGPTITIAPGKVSKNVQR